MKAKETLPNLHFNNLNRHMRVSRLDSCSVARFGVDSMFKSLVLGYTDLATT